MDFGSISGRSTKSSMKRKQSNSLLTAFRKSSQPPTSYIPPPSTTSSHFPEQPESPYPDSTSLHTHTHSQAPHNDFTPGSSGSGGGRYAESSTSSRTATNQSDMQYVPYGRGGAARVRSGSKAISLMGTLGSAGSGPSGQGGDANQAASGERRDKERERERSGGGGTIRRPEDMVRVVRDRLFSWSYMMQWYQGETHWFNTVKIPRSTTESHLGPKALESRARNFFILGISLAMVLDIPSAPELLKAVNRVLEEWEAMVEGGSKVRGLFKGQKGSRKSGSGAGGEYMSMQDSDSALMQVNLPFTLDFFQVHGTTCSLIRDIYRKILRFFLPSRAGFTPPSPELDGLVHPSTIIHSAPLDISAPTFSRSNSGSVAEHSQATMRSPSTTRSASSASHAPGGLGTGFGSPRAGDSDEMGMSMEQAFMNSTPGAPGGPRGAGGGEGDNDAFQAYILGELGPDRVLVGDGQAMTKDVIELFTKVDTRLRKHFSSLLRETDLLARRVLDDEINALMMSLNPGTTPLSFDYNAALSNTGNGFALARSKSGSRSRPGSSGTSGTGGGYYATQGGEPVPPLPTGGAGSIYGRE